MITWWMKLGGNRPPGARQSPCLFDKWHRIFYMPSCIDTAVHTKAFDYPVAEHWGKNRNVQPPPEDSNRQPEGLSANRSGIFGFPRFATRLYIILLVGIDEVYYDIFVYNDKRKKPFCIKLSSCRQSSENDNWPHEWRHHTVVPLTGIPGNFISWAKHPFCGCIAKGSFLFAIAGNNKGKNVWNNKRLTV